MARLPQPGGDRNAWGGGLNEYLGVSHNPDGTIKAAGVQTAVATEVETALSVQLPPAVAEEVAAQPTVVNAAAAAVDAEPRVSQLITDTNALTADMAVVEPAVANLTSRVYDVRSFGDIDSPANTRVAWQAALDAVSASGGGVVTGPVGTYVFDQSIQHPAGVSVDMPLGTVFDFSGITTTPSSTGGAMWYGEGALSALPALAANVPKDGRTVTFASNPGLAPGDWFVLYNSADYSFGNERPYYREGEYVQVAAVSGNSITTVNATYAAYAAGSTVTAHKMAGAEFAVRGVTLKLPPIAASGFKFVGATRLELPNTAANGAFLHAGYWIQQCVNVVMDNPRSFNPGAAGPNQYGVMIANSQHFTINDADLATVRHGLTTGGGDYVGCVPSRDVKINGGTITSTGETVAGCDLHGNIEWVWFGGVNMPKGLHVAGDHIYVDEKCVIKSSGAGRAVEISYTVGWDVQIHAKVVATMPISTSGLVAVIPGTTTVRSNGEMVIGGDIDIGSYRASAGSTFAVRVNSSAPTPGVIRFTGRVNADGVVAGDSVFGIYAATSGGGTNLGMISLEGPRIWGSGVQVTNVNSVNVFRVFQRNAPGRGISVTSTRIYSRGNNIRNAGLAGLYYTCGGSGEIFSLDDLSLDANDQGGAAFADGGGITLRDATSVVYRGATVGDTRATTKQVTSDYIANVGNLFTEPVAILGTVTSPTRSSITTTTNV